MTPENVSLEEIASRIYLIRGEKVMLDEDLALLYGVPTKRLNEQVKRNARRFPPDFLFTLSNQEFLYLKSQFATSSWGGRRKAITAFTEQGIAMLSSVLHSDRAVDVNIAVMRVFVKLRSVLQSNRELEKKFLELEAKFDGRFKVVFDAIREIVSDRVVPRKRIIGLGRR